MDVQQDADADKDLTIPEDLVPKQGEFKLLKLDTKREARKTRLQKQSSAIRDHQEEIALAASKVG